MTSEYDIVTNTQPYPEDLGLDSPTELQPDPAPRSSDCSTDRIEVSEQSEKGMWQEALIDVAACLTVEQLVRAGIKPKTIYAMRHALESPRPSL